MEAPKRDYDIDYYDDDEMEHFSLFSIPKKEKDLIQWSQLDRNRNSKI